MSIDAKPNSFVSRQDAIDYRYAGYWSDNETIPSLLARNAAEVPKRVALVDDTGTRIEESIQVMSSACSCRTVSRRAW